MPDAKLPHNAKGWFVAIAASFVGLVSGFATIKILSRIL